MEIKINGKTLLLGLALIGGASFAEYVSIVKENYAVVSQSTSPQYQGTDGHETDFPVGHVLTAWVRTGYVQSNVNKLSPIYIVNDNSDSMRYGSDWYGDHNSGTYLEGEWQYRGYVGDLGNVSTGMFVRIR